MNTTSTFMQRCGGGDARLEEIDDYIDQWHRGSSALTLYTYLGLSREEYAAWVEDPDTVNSIIRASRQTT